MKRLFLIILFLLGQAVTATLTLVQAEDFDCGRSLCGCWVEKTLEFSTDIVSDDESLSGIEVYCGSESDAVAVSDDYGFVEFSVETMYSPGCHYQRCTTLRFVDPEGVYKELTATIFVINEKEVIMEKK